MLIATSSQKCQCRRIECYRSIFRVMWKNVSRRVTKIPLGSVIYDWVILISKFRAALEKEDGEWLALH